MFSTLKSNCAQQKLYYPCQKSTYTWGHSSFNYQKLWILISYEALVLWMVSGCCYDHLHASGYVCRICWGVLGWPSPSPHVRFSSCLLCAVWSYSRYTSPFAMQALHPFHFRRHLFSSIHVKIRKKTVYPCIRPCSFITHCRQKNWSGEKQKKQKIVYSLLLLVFYFFKIWQILKDLLRQSCFYWEIEEAFSTIYVKSLRTPGVIVHLMTK